MSSNPKIEQRKTMDVQTAQRVEQERMTRRAALRKLGYGAGLTAFSLLGVDDLARMVGQRLERTAGDSKVASQIAKELQQAGVAFAGGGPTMCGNYPCGSVQNPPACQYCANTRVLDFDYCDSVYGVAGYKPNPAIFQHCVNQAIDNFNSCVCCWCFGGTVPPANNTLPPPGQLLPPAGCGC